VGGCRSGRLLMVLSVVACWLGCVCLWEVRGGLTGRERVGFRRFVVYESARVWWGGHCDVRGTGEMGFGSFRFDREFVARDLTRPSFCARVTRYR
jgi:hypothetical protein